jgi:RNA polymerase sigma-70 factor (ECF subfamily)
VAANPQSPNQWNDKHDAADLPQADKDVFWEKEAMDRVVRGDEAGLLLIYERYSGLVFRVAMHVLGDQNLAEDVAQEVFLNLWRNPSAFNSSKGNLSSWMVVMTRHRAIDILRKRRRECSIDIGELPDRKWQIEIELSEAATKISAVFPLMPVPQQVALGLAYFHGLSHSEISSKTGEPLGTVKSRIRLALEFLRKALVNPQKPKYPVPADPIPRARRK